jgi:hypothetical protein
LDQAKKTVVIGPGFIISHLHNVVPSCLMNSKHRSIMWYLVIPVPNLSSLIFEKKQFCQETGAHKFMAKPCRPAGPGYHPIPKGKLI